VPNQPSASYSLTIRCEIPNRPGQLGLVTSAIGEVGGDIGPIGVVCSDRVTMVRDLVVNARDEGHARQIVEHLRGLAEIKVASATDRTFAMHEGGKISVVGKSPVRDRDDLSMAYTPGVARVCRAIHADPAKAYEYTIRKNTVAIVSDGSAVLGLGNIGPLGAMPVMEGKALLFKEFAGVDAFPICLSTQDTDEIVRAVEMIAPTFGGVNLEDISAPRCFEIEERLRKSTDIPIFHDDQHGTAVVATAALLNALKIVGKQMNEIKVVISGVGAAGVACAKMLLASGVKNVVSCDRKGAIYAGRDSDLNPAKRWIAENTNPDRVQGTLAQALVGADVFLGVSAPNLISRADVAKMAKDPIVFAMANPDPEVRPEEVADIVKVMATGRSDYPNQINNVLCFPGLFRGALDCLARDINEPMKVAAAEAIAALVTPEELALGTIIPSPFAPAAAPAVAAAVAAAARATGVARK
jgi:malate dehydrogenase (oxaloacetate-decarboxylating)